jgi:hypothetical protein
MEVIKFPIRMLTKWDRCSSELKKATFIKHGKKAEGRKLKGGRAKKKDKRRFLRLGYADLQT